MENFTSAQTMIDKRGLVKSSTPYATFFRAAARGHLGTSELDSKMRLGTFYHTHEKKSDKDGWEFRKLSYALDHITD